MAVLLLVALFGSGASDDAGGGGGAGGGDGDDAMLRIEGSVSMTGLSEDDCRRALGLESRSTPTARTAWVECTQQ